MDRMVTAGRVGGLFGLRGEITLVLYDSFPRDFYTEEPVFVKIDSHTVPLFFKSLTRRGQRGATAVFEDIDTEARAAELVGLDFFIREKGTNDEGREADELYFEDLVGWEAEFETEEAGGAGGVKGAKRAGGRQKGRITAFFDSEFNPLLEIETVPGGERELIPAQDDFIVEVDEKRRKVVFSLPEGLLGLNK